MYTRGRTLKFTAVLALVVLTLTGFSTGRHHSTRHSTRHHSGGSGGCSSSRQDHDSSSSSTHDSAGDDDSYGSGSGSTYRRRPTHRSTPTASSTGNGGGSFADATTKLVRCATKKERYATVEVTNPNGRKGTFTVHVDFMGADDDSLIYLGSTDVSIPARATKTVKVPFTTYEDLATVDHCEARPDAYALR